MTPPVADFPAVIDSLRVTARAVERSEAHADIALLNLLLAAETLCAARYEALANSALAQRHDHLHHAFREMAISEQHHVGALDARIRALGGVPAPAPDLPAPPDQKLAEIAASNILAERGVIKLYRAALRHFGACDKETSALLREILDDESRHITGMGHLLH